MNKPKVAHPPKKEKRKGDDAKDSKSGPKKRKDESNDREDVKRPRWGKDFKGRGDGKAGRRFKGGKETQKDESTKRRVPRAKRRMRKFRAQKL